MNGLIASLNAVSGPWAEAVWRACWQGAVALGLVWVVCRAWPRLPAGAQCWLWRLAYLKLLLGVVRLPAVAVPVLPDRAPAAVHFASAFDAAPGLAAGATSASAASLTSRAALPGCASIALALWLLGAAWYTFRVVCSWRAAKRVRLQCRPPEDATLARRLRELCLRNGVTRVPALMLRGPGRPLLLGFRHPMIVLPAELLGCCHPAETQLMLAHEVAHLRRRDLLWNWMVSHS